MKYGLGLVKQAALLEVVDDHGVGFLHVQPRELLDIGQELSVEADRVLERDALFLAEAQVVYAVQRRRVHHASSFLRGDEIRIDHVVGASLLGDGVRVQGFVLEAYEVAALHAFDHVRRLLEHHEPRLGQDQELVAFLHLDVVDVVADRERDVARQRPGRGGPREDRRSGVVLEPEPDVDARIGHVVAVALSQLVTRQRGGAAGAVRGDAEASVDEVLLPHLA